MKLLCVMFGHKCLEDATGGSKYMDIRRGPTDGIDRVHCKLYAQCPRCQEMYLAVWYT